MWEFGCGIIAEEPLDKLPVKRLCGFDFIEFPGVWLDSPTAIRKLKTLRHAGCRLMVRDLVPPALARIVPQENLKVKVEFDRKFREQCRQAAELGVEGVEIQFDLDRAVREPAYGALLRSFVLSCAGGLREHALSLQLPCRLPRPPGGCRIIDLLQFRHRLGLPETGFNLEFHPYEPGAFEILEQEKTNLQYIRQSWRIVFAPEHGNQLNAGHWHKLLQAIGTPRNGSDFRIALAPGNQMPDEAMLDYLLQLLREKPSK